MFNRLVYEFLAGALAALAMFGLYQWGRAQQNAARAATDGLAAAAGANAELVRAAERDAAAMLKREMDLAAITADLERARRARKLVKNDACLDLSLPGPLLDGLR